MNRQRFGGREITVVIASETRKRPEDMRHRTRVRGPSYDDHRSSRYGRSRTRTRSRSRSPYHRPSRARHTSRSYSPASRQRDDYSASPSRRHSARSRSPRDYVEGRKEEYSCRSYSPEDRNQVGDDYEDFYAERHGAMMVKERR
ncbi:serine/arginine-rich SC35-like splicing factor SCL30 isoform X2 [Iris pallida]|uniref:Serine/arginine-rich SC35-like splicing factor SCL30 isoform X2 n=1 Tax=Iris pallida TaxID=29817 RepID=A0AAX6HYZ1_IRIPA|nr:serine/arginine-rich SC35-like splicing factor SCL30 isoform X2 [Iris pallida]